MRSKRYEADKRYAQAHKNDADRRFYRTRFWRDHLRPAVLRRDPICIVCKALSRVRPSTEVDHIIPPRGDVELQRSAENCRGLCASCHGRKTRGKGYSKEVGPDGWPIDPNHPANRECQR
jgi:5-methylcytosine-specific restriction endonuclease McrA